MHCRYLDSTRNRRGYYDFTVSGSTELAELQASFGTCFDARSLDIGSWASLGIY